MDVSLPRSASGKYALQGVKILGTLSSPAREVFAIYDDLDLPCAWGTASARPYVIINTVGSVDGRSKPWEEGRRPG